ncbi:DUF4365 domain-containing protein [Desulfobulbus sp. F1]|nr:DUF4365 domain-containing protein [Desulfobulbus sp. F1]
MNSRYSSTERIGVNAVERIVIQELGWIFREQPIVDVGVDAIIEQCENGNPTGRFIAVQIKSGESNFHISENRLAYYASHIHYHYWLNLNIPIILVVHLPNSEETYWQNICKNNFKKTDKNWKFEIPKIQELNRNSKGKLTGILSGRGERNAIFELYSGVINIETIYSANENSYSEEIIYCIKNISKYISKYHTIFYVYLEKLTINNRELFDIKSRMYRQKAIMLWFAGILDSYSDRLETEIYIYSKGSLRFFYAYEQLCLFNFLKTKDIQGLDMIRSLDDLLELMDIKSDKIELVLETETLYNHIDHPAIKEANAVLSESLKKLSRVKELYLAEFAEGISVLKIIIDRTKEKIELIKSGHDINLQFTSLP